MFNTYLGPELEKKPRKKDRVFPDVFVRLFVDFNADELMIHRLPGPCAYAVVKQPNMSTDEFITQMMDFFDYANMHYVQIEDISLLEIDSITFLAFFMSDQFSWRMDELVKKNAHLIDDTKTQLIQTIPYQERENLSTEEFGHKYLNSKRSKDR